VQIQKCPCPNFRRTEPRQECRGARHAALIPLDAIGAANAQDVLASVVEAAKAGDMRAADILLRRLWPERKGRPVTLELRTLASAADIVAALGAVAGAVAAGDLCFGAGSRRRSAR
jgi:hypothetical protein